MDGKFVENRFKMNLDDLCVNKFWFCNRIGKYLFYSCTLNDIVKKQYPRRQKKTKEIGKSRIKSNKE